MQSGNLCYGWPSVDKAAEEIYCGLHSSLLSGYPLFLYKELNTTKSTLVQVVVVKNLGEDVSDYGVGIITSGYTMLYPHIGYDYLVRLTDDLLAWKVDKKIIETYKEIIEHYGKES